jgi:hypothetical protein
MNPKLSSAIQAISEYLISEGWFIYDAAGQSPLFVDPKSENTFRCDLAFLIQTTRNTEKKKV